MGFNMRKENIVGEDYLGLQIYRFFLRCPQCASTISFKTDPKNGDYIIDCGATRAADPLKIHEVKLEGFTKKYLNERENKQEFSKSGPIYSNPCDEILAEIERERQIRVRRDNIDTDAVLRAIERFSKKREIQ